MTDTMRTGSTRAPKPAGLRHGRRNRAFIAVGASCALAGIAAVGLLQPAGTASVADAAEVPSLAEITDSQSQNYQANLVTAADKTVSFDRNESVQVELEPEPEPEPAPVPEEPAEETAVEESGSSESESSGSYESESSSSSSGSSSSAPSGTYSGESPQGIAQQMLNDRGMGDQFSCLDNLYNRESGWNPYAENPSSGAYGIPQSLPGNKMASHGSDWQTNPVTQIAWGLDYIEGRYGTPCGAWAHSESVGWY